MLSLFLLLILFIIIFLNNKPNIIFKYNKNILLKYNLINIKYKHYGIDDSVKTYINKIINAIKDIDTGLKFFSGFAMVINAMRKAPKFIIARVQGKAVGGGVGLASAADYTFAVSGAAVKLSELAVGIGPFVVGPAVERKVGKSAFTQMTIDATAFHSAEWAKEKGLYAHLYNTVEEMDAAINTLATKLSSSNPEAMSMLKKIMWEGTENWDELLIERAGMSGKLVLSDFTRNAIQKFKSAAK